MSDIATEPGNPPRLFAVLLWAALVLWRLLTALLLPHRINWRGHLMQVERGGLSLCAGEGGGERCGGDEAGLEEDFVILREHDQPQDHVAGDAGVAGGAVTWNCHQVLTTVVEVVLSVKVNHCESYPIEFVAR